LQKRNALNSSIALSRLSQNSPLHNSVKMATDDITIPQHMALKEAPRDIEAIKVQEKQSLLSHWDAGVAFQLGCALRTRLLTFERPAVVDISTVSTPPHVLFHAVRRSESMSNDTN
jgi:uncharacterized protein (UPF0303 family)